VARVLVRSGFGLLRPFLAPPGPSPRGLLPDKTTQPPCAGLALYLSRRLATLLLASILLYGPDLFPPSAGTMAGLNTFLHKIQRSTTDSFSATPTGILAVEFRLPPVSLLMSQSQRLEALRVVCSPPNVNPATAHLHTSFPSLSTHREPDSSSALTRGLKSVYLPLNWQMPGPLLLIRNHLRVDSVAHRTISFTHGLSMKTMINSHLVALTLTLSTQSLMNNMDSALKKRVREVLLKEWASLFPTPGYYLHPPA